MPEPKSTTENEKPEAKSTTGNEKPDPKTTTENEKSEPITTTDSRNPELLEWMLRPCEFYKEEYNDCKSIRARFHQYFVYGVHVDCTQWKTDYNNCHLWKKYKKKDAFDELLNSELLRRKIRLGAHYANDVWERRTLPPEHWNEPLPDYLEAKAKTSYLRIVSEHLKSGNETNSDRTSSCSIM